MAWIFAGEVGENIATTNLVTDISRVSAGGKAAGTESMNSSGQRLARPKDNAAAMSSSTISP